MPALLLGPIVRFADASGATIWVQTDEACEVEILGQRRRTWSVADMHFALVAIAGLEPGEDHPYEVRLDGGLCWPPEGSELPPSTVRLPDPDPARPLRVSFGSCRISLPNEPPYTLRSSEHPDGQGIDALRAFALRAAGEGGGAALPDTLLMIGDQIYADEPSPALQAAIDARQRPADAPDDTLADFAEYALAYHEAWSEPAIRWLLSTVPVMLIFDDHEVQAEWRTSQSWMDEMTAKPWFDRHICQGLMAYWVFQHLGNLSPDELEASALYRAVRDGPNGTEALRVAMDDAGRQTGHSRWSHARALGDVRIVAIDSRAGRIVTPRRRRLVQEEEWEWVAEQARLPSRHLLLVSSVPFLLAPALHDVEAWDEAVTDGAWGGWMRRIGERLRRLAVMDHWASFGHSMRVFAGLVDDIAHGREGEAPASIVMLSGDVHHCYLAQVRFRDGQPRTAVWQAVCSAFRKELRPHERRVIAFGHLRPAALLARVLARSAKVPQLPFDWQVVNRPDYANQIGTVTLSGEHAHVQVEAVAGDDWRDPALEVAFERELTSSADA